MSARSWPKLWILLSSCSKASLTLATVTSVQTVTSWCPSTLTLCGVEGDSVPHPAAGVQGPASSMCTGLSMACAGCIGPHSAVDLLGCWPQWVAFSPVLPVLGCWTEGVAVPSSESAASWGLATLCVCSLNYSPLCRALAMRLNARISEVTLAEQCAHADADSARAELTRVHERHQAEIDGLEQRQRQLVAALQAVGAKVDPELSAAALAGMWGGCCWAAFSWLQQSTAALAAVRGSTNCGRARRLCTRISSQLGFHLALTSLSAAQLAVGLPACRSCQHLQRDEQCRSVCPCRVPTHQGGCQGGCGSERAQPAPGCGGGRDRFGCHAGQQTQPAHAGHA